ncbi:uncharacterized protein L203_104828 [Cryptococcus depauperatus CBS 7841]|uniref:Autophagy-related protein 13 n=1 Tax=Cryptococcus depauperatus CBS 7841 TaxID=1295531 RepID=A0A1E3INP0_9TREE|nr:hypothetical protein L203_01965 [Cryptococcus depauperatus CBS 7841]
MSASPLRTIQHPPLHRQATAFSLVPQYTGERTPSASSSTAALSQVGRADQVLHRFYLKTLAVLVDARLTHYKRTSGEKKDRWFNLLLSEIDLYKNDLQVYRNVSNYTPYTNKELPSSDSDTCSIPPLLVAFILDTTDVPNGQALLWNRSSGKVALDIGSNSSKGKGKEKENRPGIVLERWTLRAQSTASDEADNSQVAPHTAYRLGIIHFRALHSLLRLLPAYRLYRRLRRSNSGLRMGIKLWSPEGYPNSLEGLKEAWQVMEDGLVSLDMGLEELVIGGEEVEPDLTERYDFSKLDLFGNEYTLHVDYRLGMDFTTEDMEAVLSEKFVDMDEDWFTPTVAVRRRSKTLLSPNTLTSHYARAGGNRTASMPAPIPSSLNSTSSVSPRQQAIAQGSFISTENSLRRNRQASSTSTVGASVSGKKDRWSALGEGLPFAGRSPSNSQNDGQPPPSPNPGSIVAARRLSGHSIQPFASISPSTSILRGTPPQSSTNIGTPIPTSSSGRPIPRIIPASRPSSSIGRTSSFLSQSGRSFTHAQLANMYTGSASPPITGVMSGIGLPSSLPTNQQGYFNPPTSPSSLTFSKQPVQRASSYSARGLSMTPGSASSPFTPVSLEKDQDVGSASPGGMQTIGATPQAIKRYSSSLSSRPSSLGQRGSSIPYSQGLTPDPSLSSSTSAQAGLGGLMRKTSIRESSLKHSLEPPSRLPVDESDKSKVAVSAADENEIQAFLRAIDAAPQPSSCSQISGSRLYTTMHHHTSSVGSSTSREPTSPLATSSTHHQQIQVHPPSPRQPGVSIAVGTREGRAPMTRAWVDDELKRMAGSFSGSVLPDSNSSLNELGNDSKARILSKTTSATNTTPLSSAKASLAGTPLNIGLLSASRPGSVSGFGGRGSVTIQGAGGDNPHSFGDGRRRMSSGRGGPSPLSQGLSVRPSVFIATDNNTEKEEEKEKIIAAPMQALEPADQAMTFTERGFRAKDQEQGGGARSLPSSSTQTIQHNRPQPPRSSGADGGVGYVETETANHLRVPAPSSTRMAEMLSPQATDGISTIKNDSPVISATTAGIGPTSRRGPVLLKGGFEHRSSPNCTPFNSPVLDYCRASASGPVGLGFTTLEMRVGSVPLRSSESGAPIAGGIDFGRKNSAPIPTLSTLSTQTSDATAPSVDLPIIGRSGFVKLRSTSKSRQEREDQVVGQCTVRSSLDREMNHEKTEAQQGLLSALNEGQTYEDRGSLQTEDNRYNDLAGAMSRVELE